MSVSIGSKAAHPRLPIVLNGGVAGVEDARVHLSHVDGVIMGRAAYQEPWRLLAVDPALFGEDAPFTSPKYAAAALVPYIERELREGRRIRRGSRATCTACSAPCRARALSAGILPALPAAMQAQRCCWMRSASSLIALAMSSMSPLRARWPSLRPNPKSLLGIDDVECGMLLGVSLHEILWLALALVIGGMISGVLAGLFGVSGGSVIVPVLYEAFRVLGVPEDVRMQLCLGTSIAIVVPTTIRSYLTHRSKGAVIPGVIWPWALPAVTGVAQR